MAEPSGTRAMLTEQIAAQIRQTNVAAADAQAKAEAIVDAKHRATRAGLWIVFVSVASSVAAFHLGLNPYVVLGLGGGGLLWAGVTMDPEYIKAGAKNLGEVIGAIAGAIKGAR